ncbi:MAG TPA: hypothetical protein VOA87_04045, partial [Thermoanaerobaculia bacterium]|nr:hypothetical protein [Thermoanaerobaculia bacterium]
MILIDLVGAALTLLAIGLLALGGYLLALRLLGDEAASDPLALAVATLLAATGQGLAISLVLGVAGYLRIAVALPLQALWTLLLLRAAHRRWPGRSLAAPFLLLARRTGSRLVAWPALALIAVHAAGSELL